MKIKGIPVWEQHVEKFILGGFGLVLLGVGAMQVLVHPNAVTMENKTVGPAEIEAALKARADAVAAKLSPNASATVLPDEGIPAGAFDAFKKSLDGGVAPRTTLPSIAPSLAAAILPSEAAVDAGRFHEPKFVRPTMLASRQEADTLDETVLQQNPALAEVFKEILTDPTGPKDINWLMPVASLDLSAWREDLRKAAPGAKPPELAIPTLWYNDSLWLVDVVFERQERIASADGNVKWGDPTVVGVLPGHFSFRKEIPTADVGLRDEMYRLLVQKDKVLEILQPEFLPTKGNTFSPALVLGKDDAAGATAEAPELRRKKQEFNRKVIDRDRTLDQVKDLGGPCEPTKPEDREKDRRRDDDQKGKEGGGDGGGAKAPGGGGLGGGGMQGGKNNSGRSKEDEEKCVRLTKKWKELDNQVKRLEEELKRLSPSTDLSNAGSVIDLAKDKSLTVWAHDIWVKPGATYRYRCRVDAYNPFFARKRQLIPEQQKLSDQFVLASATSDWGRPVTVEPPVRFFVTDASEGGGRLGLGSAKIELYRFFDGVRRAETVHVQPGDRIGGVVERRREGGVAIDFSTDWYVVDILDDSGSEKQKGAQVILRRADDPSLVVRVPVMDSSSSDRQRFADEVQAAKDAGEKEKDDAKEPEKPGDGSGAPRGPGGGFGGPSGK
jgi:hypothetical protein